MNKAEAKFILERVLDCDRTKNERCKDEKCMDCPHYYTEKDKDEAIRIAIGEMDKEYGKERKKGKIEALDKAYDSVNQIFEERAGRRDAYPYLMVMNMIGRQRAEVRLND